jgi:hypothetical protein
VLLLRRAGTRRRVPPILGGAAVIVVAALLGLVPTAAGSVNDTLPSISYTIDGILGSNGWYRGSAGGNYVVVRWSVTGADSTDCTFAVRVDGPTTGTTRSCSASNAAGPVTATTRPIKIDADPPIGVAASPARAADANGWYNHAVALSWHGSDATSGIASCSAVTYAGPDAAPASVPGSCIDNAGNTASVAFALNYDSSAPKVSDVKVVSSAAADVLRWKSSSPADTAVVSRAARGSKASRVVFRGAAARFVDRSIRAGVEYRYSVRTYDQAGNASNLASAQGLPKVVPLHGPAYVARTSTQPILRWPRAKSATYYHVQLFRRGKRILAAWPRTSQLALRPTWVWAGKRYKLTPGRYRWFAWAGFGARSAARYKLLGKDDFIVTRG